MDVLRAMRVFAKVIDEGSFAAASRSLDTAPAVVTRLIAELEEHLGARLMNRTTRRLSLTDVGEVYLERVRQILADIEDAEMQARSEVTEPKGHVRVLCPPAIAVHQLAKHLPRFHELRPQVTVEVSSPGAVEAVDESFDITIMASRTELDGNFIARRLARAEAILCASPEYLDQRGRPVHPRDLRDHDALIPPISELQRGITFTRGMAGPDGQPETYTSEPRRGVLMSTHIDTNYAAALAGLGIAALPSYVIEDALLENALERVMPEWRLFSATLWACMPTRKHLPARTRALLDYLVVIFGGEDRDPWLAAAGCETTSRRSPACTTDDGTAAASASDGEGATEAQPGPQRRGAAAALK